MSGSTVQTRPGVFHAVGSSGRLRALVDLVGLFGGGEELIGELAAAELDAAGLGLGPGLAGWVEGWVEGRAEG